MHQAVNKRRSTRVNTHAPLTDDWLTPARDFACLLHSTLGVLPRLYVLTGCMHVLTGCMPFLPNAPTACCQQDGLQVPGGAVSGLFPSPLTVTAFTNCDLYALPALEFREVIDQFPAYRKKLMDLSIK